MTTKFTPHVTATSVAASRWRRGIPSQGERRDTQERVDFLDITHKLCCMVDIRRLRALRAVADHGTLAAAADALHLTPSAVSQQLAALERETGHRLLEPAGRSVRLTPAAAVLLRHADAVFAQLERLDGDLAAQAAGAAGEVRLAGFPTSLIGLVAPAAARLREDAPAVRLAVTEAETDAGVLLLGRRDVDVIVGMECSAAPRPGDARFHREALLGDVLDAALPVGHPLAGGAPVRLTDLAEEGFIAPPVGWSCDEVLSAGCRAAGFSPRVAHRSGDWQAVMALIRAGLGIALIPRLAQQRPPGGVVLLPLAGSPPERHVFVACRRGAEAAPAVRAVFDALHAVADQATAVPLAA
jgi:DNA-binding transcriptional LysR family regulator